MNFGQLMAIESPPLWIWAALAGAIIAAKFIYRWCALKQLARESGDTKQHRST